MTGFIPKRIRYLSRMLKAGQLDLAQAMRVREELARLKGEITGVG